jgi:hypothetical protein
MLDLIADARQIALMKREIAEQVRFGMRKDPVAFAAIQLVEAAFLDKLADALESRLTTEERQQVLDDIEDQVRAADVACIY